MIKVAITIVYTFLQPMFIFGTSINLDISLIIVLSFNLLFLTFSGGFSAKHKLCSENKTFKLLSCTLLVVNVRYCYCYNLRITLYFISMKYITTCIKIYDIACINDMYPQHLNLSQFNLYF